jgi:hypothetical protein
MAVESIIQHNIFLEKDQRYQLGKNHETIDVIGDSMSVWVKERTIKPTENQPCSYRISVGKSKSIVRNKGQDDCSYRIILSQEHATELLNPEDYGKTWVQFTYQSNMKKHSFSFKAKHYVNIRDSEVLKDSISV